MAPCVERAKVRKVGLSATATSPTFGIGKRLRDVKTR